MPTLHTCATEASSKTSLGIVRFSSSSFFFLAAYSKNNHVKRRVFPENYQPQVTNVCERISPATSISPGIREIRNPRASTQLAHSARMRRHPLYRSASQRRGRAHPHAKTAASPRNDALSCQANYANASSRVVTKRERERVLPRHYPEFPEFNEKSTNQRAWPRERPPLRLLKGTSYAAPPLCGREQIVDAFTR